MYIDALWKETTEKSPFGPVSHINIKSLSLAVEEAEVAVPA